MKTMAKKLIAEKHDFETFRPPSDYMLRDLQEAVPACFNSFVRVRKYRVTYELIDEPDEVVADRILKLWRESDNYHDVEPLRKEAAKIGLELDMREFRRDQKRPD